MHVVSPGGYTWSQTDRCLVAGAKIEADSGQVCIELIRTGDKVYAETGCERCCDRDQTSSDKQCITSCFSDGTELTGTPNHPVYVKGKGFIAMDSLV